MGELPVREPAAPLWASVAARKAGLLRHRRRLRKRLLIGVGLVLTVAVLSQVRGMLVPGPQGPQEGVRSHAAAGAAAFTPAVH